MMRSAASSIAAVAFSLFAVSGLGGCGSTLTTVQPGEALRGSAHWVMLPVANYSETPQAGERIEEMLDTVLRRNGVQSLDRYPPIKEDDAHLVVSDRQRFEESLAWARTQHFDYAVTGSVEEWRYKSGLDGDPAVGLSVRVLELQSQRVLWSGSGTKTGTSGDNASGTALALLGTLLQQMSLGR
jgi:hypothetical protein